MQETTSGNSPKSDNVKTDSPFPIFAAPLGCGDVCAVAVRSQLRYELHVGFRFSYPEYSTAVTNMSNEILFILSIEKYRAIGHGNQHKRYLT